MQGAGVRVNVSPGRSSLAQFSIWTQGARQQAALAAALLIGAQLILGYWFYSYLTWCYPLLIVAMIQARSEQQAPDAPADAPATSLVAAYSARSEA